MGRIPRRSRLRFFRTVSKAIRVRVSCQTCFTPTQVTQLGLTSIIWCARGVFDHVGVRDHDGWVVDLFGGGVMYKLFITNTDWSGSARGRLVREDQIVLEGDRRARRTHA